MVLVLFETPAGFALFKVLKEKKLEETQVRAGRAAGWRSSRRPPAPGSPPSALAGCRGRLRNAGHGPEGKHAGSGRLGRLSGRRNQLPMPRMQVVKLKAFSKFENTTEALAAATALVDSKLSKGAPGALIAGRRGTALRTC
jgi:hypothetical protein